MAVSPLRALLAAQFQAAWNRMQREGGEASVVAGGIVAVIALVAMAPPVGGSFLLGRSVGRGLATGDALAVGATVLQALLLLAAVLGGLIEHQLAYSVEGFRLYPVPRLSLLVAELVTGMLNLLALLAGLCGLSLAIGLSASAPRAAPVFLLIAAQGVVWIALVQHGAAVAKRLLAGSRFALAALAVALVALLVRVGPEAGGGLRETVRAAGRAFAALVQWLPFSVAYRGAAELLQGQASSGLLRQLVLIAATAALFGLVALFHFAAADLAARGRRSKAERLWSYRNPVAALARLFQDQFLASREGRIALFLPLVVSMCLAVTIAATAELQARTTRGPLPWPLSMVALWNSLPLVGIFLVFLPTLDDMWLNQFGLDGPAIRGLLLMPVRPEQILLGRTLGLVRVNALKLAVGVGPILLMEGRPALVEIAWGLPAALVDRLMSTWRADSELSRFNAQPAGVPFALSAETVAVLGEAWRVGTLSGGAFDVTVGPLVRAWGFGPTPRVPRSPAAVEVERVRQAVGQRLVRLEPRERRATKARDATECDLSAIAPGYAADRVTGALRELGLRDVLVDVAGEVRAAGRRPGGGAWRVAIESPDGGPPALWVRLEEGEVATSGDYASFYRDERGVRRSHLIDRRTGAPVAHAVAAVSVVRPTAMEADALATALLVLGPEDGLALAEREAIAAYFTLRQPDGGYATRATPAFAALLER